jgi:hypothetical protein
MALAAHPYPTVYPGFASKLCRACLDQGRGHVVLRPFFMRAVDEDYASLVFACRRCLYQDPMVTICTLDSPLLTAPAVTPSYT